jgi:hypothetical protein
VPVHTGALNATPDTGSPIAETGIVEPSFATVQSASVIILFLGGVAEALVCASPKTAVQKRKTKLITTGNIPDFLMLSCIVVSPVWALSNRENSQDLKSFLFLDLCSLPRKHTQFLNRLTVYELLQSAIENVCHA